MSKTNFIRLLLHFLVFILPAPSFADYTFTPNIRINDDDGTRAQLTSFSRKAMQSVNGTIYMAWLDSRNYYYFNTKDIYFSKSTDGGKTFGQNVRVVSPATTNNVASVSLVVDNSGQYVYITFANLRPGSNYPDIYLARSTDGGASFKTSIKVDTSQGDPYQYWNSVAVDKDGNVYVVWEERDYYDYNSTNNAYVHVAKSIDHGATFLPKVKVGSGTGFQGRDVLGYPDISVDDAGNIYVVWQNDYAPEAQISFAVSKDGGSSFSEEKLIDAIFTPQGIPTVMARGNGEVFVAWSDNRRGYSTRAIYLYRSTNGGSSFMSPVIVNNDIALDPISMNQDADGKIYFAWLSVKNYPYDKNIYMSWSEDNGATFNPAVKVNETSNLSGYYDGGPIIASDGQGQVFVMWTDSMNGNPDIYFAASEPVKLKPSTDLSGIDTPCDNGGRASLSWTLSPDDATLSSGSKKVTGYNVYRSDISGGPYTTIATVSPGTVGYTDTSATIGITYYYVVKATDGTNESTASNEASAASARNLPSSPANLTATDTPNDLGGSITINWTKSSDDGAGLNNVAGYSIYRYSSTNGNIVSISSVLAGTTSNVDNTTTDGETYYYLIKASDGHCNAESSASNIAAGQSARNLPLPPTNVTAIDTPCDNGGSITLTWSKSVDDGAGLNNVIGYNVYRATASGGSYGKIGSVAAGVSNFVDGSSVSGTTYSYVVRATDGSNESSNSNSDSAASVRNLPLSPANMAASDTTYDLGGSITLSWTKSADDGAGLNNVLSYNIYRYSSPNTSVTLLASVSAGTTGYVDNTTVDADTYYYFIKALDNHCNMESPASNTASGQSVNNFTALSGFIGSLPGISSQLLNSLTSKADNAIASYESGNTTASINKLNALLNEISAQSDKGIEASTAQTLTTYVQNLIAFINAGLEI